MRYILPIFLLFSTLTASDVLWGQDTDAAHSATILEIALPITGKSEHAIARALDRVLQERSRNAERKGKQADDWTLILEFKVNTDQEEFGDTSSFGACYELAELLLSDQFAGVKMIAFIPQTVKGHAVLVALACNERVIAEHAEIGEASIDEKQLTPTHRQSYLDIAKRRSSLSLALVNKMLDPTVDLMQVETEKALRLVTADELDELKRRESFVDEPTPLIPAGQPGLLTAAMARKVHFVSLIADDRVQLARGLGFRPDEIKTVPVPTETGHAVRIDINGIITGDNTGRAIRSILKILDENKSGNEQPVNFICVVINSPGGNLGASLNLAATIVQDVDSSKIRTVAYIPSQARSDAALIALACDEIVLAPNAILGGDGAVVFSENQISEAKRTVVEFLCRESVRSWSLPVGMIDPDIEVFKMTRQGRQTIIGYLSEEELQSLPDAELWQKGDVVKPAGKLFEIVGGKGHQYFVDRTANDFAEFKFLYGLENDPTFVAPSWADQLVLALSSPGMSMFLLFVAFIAAGFETKTPGLGLGAFVFLLCIILFFWLNFLGGTAGWLEVTLFVAGVGFLALEIFVLPGFGIAGIGGITMIVASLVLATQTFVIPRNSYQLAQMQQTVLFFILSGIGVIVLVAFIARHLHTLGKPNNFELIQETEKLASYDHLLGVLGVTTTPLVPAGKAMFGAELVDVVSDGELVDRNSRVTVFAVEGYRVVVRPVS